MKKLIILCLLLATLCACNGAEKAGRSSNASTGGQPGTGLATSGAATDATAASDATSINNIEVTGDTRQTEGSNEAESSSAGGNKEAVAYDIANPANYFGFADETGKRLIIPSAGIPDGIGNPQDIGYAIGDNGSAVEIQYVKRQNAGKEDNGRLTMYNFANIEGYIFDVKSTAVVPNNSYYLVRKEGFVPGVLIKSGIQDNSKLDAETIRRIETNKQRKVKNAWLLTSFETDKKVCLVEFEKEQENMLASIVFVQPGNISFKDYPAKFDGSSAWRVDDGGEIIPEMFHILFISRFDQKIHIGITWGAAEGENEFILRENGAVLEETGNTAGRYWSPA